MLVNLIYNPVETSSKFIEDLIDASGIKVEKVGNSQYVINEENRESYESLINGLKKFGISLSDCPRVSLVARIKSNMTDMLEHGITQNLSEYLSRRVNLSYPHLSRIFREETYMNVESYFIFLKIQKVRKLITVGLSLTEISYLLGYSSVAHLSRQFKQKIGLTFKDFQKLHEQRTSQ